MTLREHVPEFEAIAATRIVARPAALDGAAWPAGALALRLAPDELLFTANIDPRVVDDPHAIVIRESGFAGAWIASATALEFLTQACEWELPSRRPAFAQGAVAGLPVKLWFEEDRVFFLVPAAYLNDLLERME
jgi:hypothetical protein